MKKIYISPSVEVIKVNQQNMIAVSLDNGETITPSNMSDYTQDTKEDNGWDIWDE